MLKLDGKMPIDIEGNVFLELMNKGTTEQEHKGLEMTS